MKKKILMVLTLALCCNMTAGSNLIFAGENTEADTSVMEDIAYVDDGEDFHLLDVHGVDASGEKKPVIVEVHGGSYIGGVKEINTNHSNFYADNGFAVVNTNYKTMNGSGFDRVVQDLTAVLNWVEDNAEEYHFDLDNVFMSGDSAGGYFVTLMANVLTSQELQEYYQVEIPEYTVKGYVLTCPGEDIRAIAAQFGKEGMSANIANHMGEDVIANEDVVDHADIYTILDPETFPEVYILTTPDDTILYNETKAFHEYLEEQGIVHQYREYESDENQLEHVFNIGHTDWKESIQANEDIVAYLKTCIK